MPRFRFEATDSTGETRPGHIQAVNADEAMQMLRQQELFVVALQEVREDSSDASDVSATAADSVSTSENSVNRVGGPQGRWFGAIFLAVGLACAAIGLAGVVGSVWFGMGAERAEAFVVKPRDWTNKGGYTVDILEFTASGRQYRVEARGSFGIRWGNTAGGGVLVDVLFPRDNPEQARLAAFVPRFIMPLILLVLGLMFTPAGVLMLSRGMRLNE